MSQKYGLDKIDLSGLPDALRQKVQAQLNQMTPEKQKEFLQKAQPMLNRAKDALKQADTRSMTTAAKQVGTESLKDMLEKARLTPHGHFNQTIRPGDRNSFSLTQILVVGLVSYLIYYALSSS
jgi:FKBP-type peptidyl-prolyl cis-trans isomerase